MANGGADLSQSSAHAQGVERKGFKPYPAYKDSGVEWLGQIPAHWNSERLRFACRVNPGKSEIDSLARITEVSFLPMEAIGEDGRISLQETRTLEQVWQGYTYFRDGDVIVAKITPCFENGKGALCAGLLGGIGFGTTELQVLRPGNRLHPPFLFYLTSGHAFRNLGIASMQGAAGQQRVTDEFIKDSMCPLPSIPEQQAVAAFLDRETARIDALVAKKERLIELLQEKRSALITQAVTKGLPSTGSGQVTPTVPRKDSGVEWLGEIPAHWEVRRNKILFREIDQRSVTGKEELLTVSHITGVTRRSEKEVYMIEAESQEGYKICKSGDLAINTMWAWMGALGVAREDGIVSPSYNVYRFRAGNLRPRYYDYLSRIPHHVSELIRYSKGVWKSRLRLYPEEFFEIHTPLPDPHEQQLIVDFLDRETAEIDALIAKVREGIAKLTEYRTALISAAVTGKIDVREAV